MEAELELEAEEAEHAEEAEEAAARRAIVRILNRDPYAVWTRDSLARSLGVSASLTERILSQLASSGMVHRLVTDDGHGDNGDGGHGEPGDEIEYTVAAEPY